MQKYNLKNLFKIIFPHRKSLSLKTRIKRRFSQILNFSFNVFKEVFFVKFKNKKFLKENNKKNILIIIDGNRILGNSNCPTTERLLIYKI